MFDIGNMVLDGDRLKSGQMVYIDEETEQGKLYVHDIVSPKRDTIQMSIMKKVNDETFKCPEWLDQETFTLRIAIMSFIHNWEDIQINGEEFPFTEENLHKVFFDETFHHICTIFTMVITKAINKSTEYYADKKKKPKRKTSARRKRSPKK